jgi:hypothetical protein
MSGARTWTLKTKPGRQTLAVAPDSIEGWGGPVLVVEAEPVADLLERLDYAIRPVIPQQNGQDRLTVMALAEEWATIRLELDEAKSLLSSLRSQPER